MPTLGPGKMLLLEAKNISVSFGAVRAIEGVSFNVGSGEIVAMVGPNGAGKSTALKAVFGMVPLDAGSITFNGNSILGLRPDELVKKGMSLIPEGRRVFPSMTVTENLEMGAFQFNWNERSREIGRVLELLPALKDRRKLKAGVLSTGEQQLLAFGRVLMQKPELLLADEPSLGLSPNYIDIVFEKLEEINKQGTSILLVEQNAQMALDLADRAYVFRIGGISADGTPKDLLNDDALKKVF